MDLVTGAVEVWALLAVNFLGFILGTVVTGISYYTYRSTAARPSLKLATIGFALLTLATAIEPTYQIVIERTYVLVSEQVVWLKVFEGTVFALGFLVLFYSIVRYRPRRERHSVAIEGVDDDLFDDCD